jgi:hypothetical protein
MVMVTSYDRRGWFSRTVSNRGLPVIGRALCLELREKVVGWCSLQDSNLGMYVCKTDALAAWRSEQRDGLAGGIAQQKWCTREDLNLHAVSCRRRAFGAMPAASEAVASTVSPRAQVELMVPQRRIERRFPPYQSGALPLDDCGR